MTQARASLREPLLAFAAATALGAAFGLIGTFVPLVHKYLALLIAIIFFQTPIVAARRAGRDIDYRDLGLRADPIGLNLKVLGYECVTHEPTRGAMHVVLRRRAAA